KKEQVNNIKQLEKRASKEQKKKEHKLSPKETKKLQIIGQHITFSNYNCETTKLKKKYVIIGRVGKRSDYNRDYILNLFSKLIFFFDLIEKCLKNISKKNRNLLIQKWESGCTSRQKAKWSLNNAKVGSIFELARRHHTCACFKHFVFVLKCDFFCVFFLQIFFLQYNFFQQKYQKLMFFFFKTYKAENFNSKRKILQTLYNENVQALLFVFDMLFFYSNQKWSLTELQKKGEKKKTKKTCAKKKKRFWGRLLTSLTIVHYTTNVFFFMTFETAKSLTQKREQKSSHGCG
ncbi:hypothetical protein RFI_05484, partial [Reticulomyxa filosa]